MKIIDLLNKIANGEQFPKKIKYQGDIYEYDEKIKIFYNEEENMELMEFVHEYDLREDIEIIEPPKELEKICWNDKSSFANCEMTITGVTEMLMSRTEQLKKSLSEIIDYINSKED